MQAFLNTVSLRQHRRFGPQLIERRVAAKWRVCSLRRDRLAEAERWINDARLFWERGFDRLEAFLNAQDPPRPKG